MDQSRRQFLAETEDLIEQISTGLDELREQPGGDRVQRDLVDAIFRRLHRVKGSAASFGFEGLSEIAHQFESLLNAVRAGRASVNADLLDTCESAAGAMAESLHLASSGIFEPSRHALFDRMQTLAQGVTLTPVVDTGAILSEIPLEIWQSLTGDEKQLLMQAVEEGTHFFVVTASFDIADFDDQFRRLKKRLGESGEVIATTPAVDPERSDQINFRVLFTSKGSPQDVNANLTDFSGVGVSEVAGGRSARPPDAEAQERSTVAGLKLRPAASLSNFIHIDAEEIDRLISSTYELFRTTTRALDLALSQTQIESRVQEELKQLDGQITRSFLGVERELIGLRMVFLGPVLQRAARAGRAAARLSKKEIDFRIVGAKLRLDRLLCDAIADPLVHLVRNAVDHGIEASGQTAGSPTSKRALVCIEASSEGRQTCLRVTDNGRGVDPALVTKAAVRLGIIDKDTHLDMDRSLRLIFRPGFTTLSSVSTVSGRGVGLDVVETAVEQVGGEVRVSTEPGKGATFEIRLPITVGLLDATLIFLGSSPYCIDTRQIVKTEIIEARQIETTGAGATLKSADGVLPLVRLSVLLGQATNEQTIAGPVQIVVCEFPERFIRGKVDGNKRIGIIVDRVQEGEEVLVRNLGRHAARWPGVAGATELRDGTVALVLDLVRLVSNE